MSVDVLREAAALMRERAEAALSYPEWAWKAERSMVAAGFETTAVSIPEADESVFEDRYCSIADAAHIASWHPAVAMAVAEWLEVTARDVGTSSLAFHAATAAATAYLGDPTP